jgi:hypothetical protein
MLMSMNAITVLLPPYLRNIPHLRVLDADDPYQLSPTEGEARLLDVRFGDLRLIWDRTKPDEVTAARAAFDSLKAKRYLAYRVRDKEGEKGALVRDFDPQLERLIMSPPLVGG